MTVTALNAPIQEVTVYVDRARILRRGTIHLAEGEHTLSLPNLPTTLQDDSVRASGRGANVRILGVDVAVEFVSEQAQGKAADWQNQLRALQDEDSALADSDEIETRRLDFLKELQMAGGVNLAKAVAYGKSTLESIQSLTQYMTRELEEIYARRREISQKRRNITEQIATLQNLLSSVEQPATYETREIHVTVAASAETDLELEVIYGVTGASWEPLYDIRLVDNKVALTYLANVRQQTGEDWPAVPLSLSTARPAMSSAIPELDPWFIDVYRPPVVYARRAMAAMPMMAASAQEGGMADRAVDFAAQPEAEIAQAEIESDGASVTYRVARPVAVPSDGAPHKTTVTTMDLDAQLDYVTVPKLAEEAYLRAKVTNSSRFVFLPGSASIFHGADFIGTTSLETVVPSGELEVQLGVDDRIKVERDLTARQTGKAFIGNTKRTTYGYKITLTSRLDLPARITVLDQLPVSRNEEIKVKLQELSPNPTSQSDLNILKWELQLAPQQKQEITFDFVVEQPRTMQVAGITD